MDATNRALMRSLWFACWHIEFISELPTTSNNSCRSPALVDYTNLPTARALKYATVDEIV